MAHVEGVFSPTEIAGNSDFATEGFILYLIYFIFMVCACIINGYKTRSDLWTTDRNAISHLNNQPPITGTYALIMLLTEASIAFFTISMFIMIMTYIGTSFTDSNSECNFTESISASIGEVAKIALYLVYLARLRWLYAESKVRKILWFLKCSVQWSVFFALIIVVYGIIVIFACLILWNSIVGRYYSYNDGVGYPDYCDSPMEPISGGLCIIGDIIFSFGFLYTFWTALDEALKINAKHQEDSSDVVNKIKRSGRKTCILTAVASFSTVILIILTIILDLNFVVGFDSVMHTITIMLMTPYYPDEKYYHRICYCCVKLCGGPPVKDQNENEEELLSVDTFDQLKILNEQQAVSYADQIMHDVNKVKDDLKVVELQGGAQEKDIDKVKADIKQMKDDVTNLENAINQTENT